MGGSDRQARAEATRQQLLLAARDVFSERGYGGATVAAITAAADTAHGTFYLYFRNKEDVFVHVISDVLEDLYQVSFTPPEQLSASRDPVVVRDRIADFLRAMARHGALWRAVLEGALASPVVEQHWMDQRRRFHARVAERWRQLLVSGDVGGLDIELAVSALGSMLEWFALTGLVFDEPRPLVVDDHVVDTLTELWLRAASPAR
ncbi:MAG TPA: TetR/AcrR family transcriptional regulator [Aquihabitans sp.]|jgi:AcrR family transcriptional regulator|nr:TetR/AcrR family transcriptional regulator [Aquihabitans sp.]